MGEGYDLRYVVVDGWGRLADEVAGQLRRCGVPVRAGGHAADSAEATLGSGSDPTTAGEPDAVPPRAVVVVADGRAPGWAGAPWQARGIPHLPVVVGGRRVVVGPLVLPGRTACLRCARQAWGAGCPPAADTPGGGLVLAAAVATVTVLAVLRGDHSLGGISTEIGLDEVAVTHRLWNPRPGCRCARVRMAG
jgi:hypothetical protein